MFIIINYEGEKGYYDLTKHCRVLIHYQTKETLACTTMPNRYDNTYRFNLFVRW